MEQQTQAYIHPQQQDAQQAMASLTKLLLGITDILNTLRREFRGEALWQDKEGENHYIQISKPAFVKINFETNKPISQRVKMPWQENGKDVFKDQYVANDEAIEEVLSMVKFMGVNQISPLGVNTEDNYLDDLREFECKLAAVLALKQKEWGLDKELLPMIQTKIKTLVQDVRSMAIKGKTIDSLTKSVQRVEQMIEGDIQKKRITGGSPYGAG